MKAFPSEHTILGTMNTFADGMDLRDYFAAQAMQALIQMLQTGPVDVARNAYFMADAMMKAREL